jgi:hypothetical protein
MYLRYELYAEFVGEQSHIEGILWIQNLFAEVSWLIGVMMTHTAQPLCSRDTCPSFFVSYGVPAVIEPMQLPRDCCQ